MFDKSATKSVQLSQRLKVISKCSISTIPSYFFTDSRFILRTSLQISKDDKRGSSEDIFTDQELFGSNNCVIGQAHHMFSRFLILRIYEFFSRNFLCFVFDKVKVFCWDQKWWYNCLSTEKDILEPSKKWNIKGPDHLGPGLEQFWQISGVLEFFQRVPPLKSWK